MECAARPATEPVREPPREAAQALAGSRRRCWPWPAHLEDILDDEADELSGSERARIEGALRGLDRRARMTLPAWRSMLAAHRRGRRGRPGLRRLVRRPPPYGRIHDAALPPPLGRPDRAADEPP
jgi:ATP-dependent DNA helicase DinG